MLAGVALAPTFYALVKSLCYKQDIQGPRGKECVWRTREKIKMMSQFYVALGWKRVLEIEEHDWCEYGQFMLLFWLTPQFKKLLIL